jgi:hypothetical protein
VVEVRRGIETLPIETTVDLTQHGSEPLTLRLRRWIDMRKEGYLSGDTHVHFLSQSEAHSQMRAEDLNVLNLLVSDFTNDREKFTGDLDPVSTPGNAVYVGQESRDWQNGHVILPSAVIEPFAPYGQVPGPNEPNLVISRILQECAPARAQPPGPISATCPELSLHRHRSRVGGCHRLITYDDPTQLQSLGPWTNSGCLGRSLPSCVPWISITNT